MTIAQINNEKMASLNLKAGSTFLYANTTTATVKKVTDEEVVFTTPSQKYPGHISKQRLSIPHFLTSMDYYKTITDIKS